MNIGKFTTLCIFSLLILGLSGAVSADGSGHVDLKFTPSDEPDIDADNSISITAYDDAGYCTSIGQTVVYSVVTSPPVGTITLDASFASNGEFSYANDGVNGYLTADKNENTFQIHARCSGSTSSNEEEDHDEEDEDHNDDGHDSDDHDEAGHDGDDDDGDDEHGSNDGDDDESESVSTCGASSSNDDDEEDHDEEDEDHNDDGHDSDDHDEAGHDGDDEDGDDEHGSSSSDSDGHDGDDEDGDDEHESENCEDSNSGNTQNVKPLDSNAVTATCSAANTTGVVIIDNTATPGQASISTNLSFLDGCDKTASTLDDGYGGNVININDFHSVNRDTSESPDQLDLMVGNSGTTVDSDKFGTQGQLSYYNDGQLFDLDRLRAIADWISGTGNVTPDSGVESGTYGTISYERFLDNVADAHTMYGVVRVKVPLEAGVRTCTGDDCTKNALGETVANVTDIYSFCSSNAGLCSCAPGAGTDLDAGNTYCSQTMTNDSRIKVKGSLIWDFVDNLTGDPIPMANLPFNPSELGFTVSLPIMVNWDHDATGDGIMDNMSIIKAITNGETAGDVTPSPSISFDDIPQSSKDAYLYTTGSTLDSTEFDTLSEPNKYHLLMASGYADGWAEAFDKLNITTSTWATLPTATECANYSSNTCTATLDTPAGASDIMTANDVRSDEFEDLPSYVYSGGLIGMHGHVNISGLLYVPQALEMEAKDESASSPTQQFISGSIVVRDGFYIEANDNTITVISSEPSNYSTARTTAASKGLDFVSGGPGIANAASSHTSNNGGSGGDDNSCVGCVSSDGSSSGGGSSSTGTNGSRWIEIHPQ